MTTRPMAGIDCFSIRKKIVACEQCGLPARDSLSAAKGAPDGDPLEPWLGSGGLLPVCQEDLQKAFSSVEYVLLKAVVRVVWVSPLLESVIIRVWSPSCRILPAAESHQNWRRGTIQHSLRSCVILLCAQLFNNVSICITRPELDDCLRIRPISAFAHSACHSWAIAESRCRKICSVGWV